MQLAFVTAQEPVSVLLGLGLLFLTGLNFSLGRLGRFFGLVQRQGCAISVLDDMGPLVGVGVVLTGGGRVGVGACRSWYCGAGQHQSHQGPGYFHRFSTIRLLEKSFNVVFTSEKIGKKSFFRGEKSFSKWARLASKNPWQLKHPRKPPNVNPTQPSSSRSPRMTNWRQSSAPSRFPAQRLFPSSGLISKRTVF